MKIKLIKTVAVLGIGVILCMGCGGKQDNQNASPGKDIKVIPAKWEHEVNQSLSDQVKPYVQKQKGVTEVHAVNSKKELMVAVKLKTLQRFNALQIVQGIEKKLQKQYPKVKVQVSSDRKIYTEVSDLENQLDEGKVRPKTLEKKIKRIDQFMKDQDPSKE